MLRFVKKRVIKNEHGARKGLIALFAATMVMSSGVSFAYGAGSTVSAMSAADTTTQPQNVVVYGYKQMSLHDVYPYYIVAAFMVAGGLSLYAATYIPSSAERRSRYASRFETRARTTY